MPAPPAAASAILAALVLGGCAALGPSAPSEATLPEGRSLVRDGLAPAGDRVAVWEEASGRCGAVALWLAEPGAAGPLATAPPPPGGGCAARTARLAPDGRTLGLYDHSAGQAILLAAGTASLEADGAVGLAAPAGFAFPPPGPNLAFDGRGSRLLLGASNRACQRRRGGIACGTAELFARTAAGWETAARLRPADESARREVRFGQAAALSADGTLALVGGTGQPGHPGGLWLFALEGGKPREIGSLRPDRPDGWFAHDLALSRDARWLAVGGEQAVYLYRRTGEGFRLHARLTAPEPGAGHFGESVALAADGRTLLVGARSPCAAGSRCGAAYLYARGDGWDFRGAIRPAVERAGADFGHRAALSADGRRLAVQGAVLHLFTRP